MWLQDVQCEKKGTWGRRNPPTPDTVRTNPGGVIDYGRMEA